MKKLLTILLTASCFVSGTAHALPFLDLPAFIRWRDDMTSRIDEVFNNLVPTEERQSWKKLPLWEGSYVWEEEVCMCWIPLKEFGSNSTEQLSCTFSFKPYRKQGNKRPFLSIDEYFECYAEKSHNKESKNLVIKRISDSEGFVECERENDKWNTIEYVKLIDDWLIAVTYDYDFKNKEISDWKSKKELWKDRFSQISFEMDQ